MSDDFTLKIAGKPYSFAAEDLELGEAELIETELNSALEDVDWRRAAALRCLAFILLRRENPAVTMDEVRALKVSDFDESTVQDVEAGKAPTDLAPPAAINRAPTEPPEDA